jgi:hypothetical protein
MFGVAMTFVIAFVVGPAAAHWDETMPHKMHFPQLPDVSLQGWDVNSTFAVEWCCSVKVADDWTCSETGWVQDIHWWGSWMDDVVGEISYFRIEIYSNDPGPPSKPDRLLWEYNASYTGLHVEEFQTATAIEGWLCPCCGAAIKPDHMLYYQYNLDLPETAWFEQEQGEIYWLSIQAVMGTGGQPGCWGWKTADTEQYPPPHTGNHYMDDAAYSCNGGPWMELRDPFDDRSLDLAFVITGEPYENLSCWTWQNLQTGTTGSRPLVCPDGDGPTKIWVCLQDGMGLPMPGVPVQANFTDASGCLFTCKPVTGVTNAAGHAVLTICGGLEVSGGPACCPVVTSVTAAGVGVIPYWSSCCPPGGIGPFPDDGGMEWLSPDMTQSGASALRVEGLDFTIFGSDWLTNACRSDYDCNGFVSGIDFAIFATHWLHDCSSCP